MTVEQYVSVHSPHSVDLVASLRTASIERRRLQQEQEHQAHDQSQDLYPAHKAAETLEAGIKSCVYFAGKLRVLANTSSASEAVVLGAYHGDNIVVVGQRDRNRAIHGDSVVVELLPRDQWKATVPVVSTQQAPPQLNEEAIEPQHDEQQQQQQQDQPTGRVVGIRQRNWRPFVVTLQPSSSSSSSSSTAEGQESTSTSSGHVVAVPMDHRIPKVRIHLNDTGRFANKRLVVRAHDWPENSLYPNGHFVRSLGPVDVLDTEVEAVLVENEITITPFSDALLQSMPVNTPERPWLVTQRDLDERRDLRATHVIFSIDPKGSEDVDDALSAKLLPNGHVELGVHIADVSAFVTPGSLADIEAKRRGTTVYLADRRFNMLPTVLSEDLCSLRGNMDRFAGME